MENMQKINSALRSNVPWSLSLIGLLKDNKCEQIVCEKNCNYIALKNSWHEWLCYIDSKFYLNEFLCDMLSELDDNRIIIYAKEDLFDNLVFDDEKIKYEVEDFMCCTRFIQGDSKYYIAQTEDIPIISLMQTRYCIEEVGWKYYHLDINSYQKLYSQRLIDGKVFMDRSHMYSKVEVTDIFEQYGKINSVYTIFNQRGQGLATECLRGVLSWASDNRIKLCLNVRKDNDLAKKLYLKMGFRKNGAVLYLKKD